MARRLRSILSILLLLSFIVSSAKAQNPQLEPSEDNELAAHVPEELLIRFSPGMSSSQAADHMAEMGVIHKRARSRKKS